MSIARADTLLVFSDSVGFAAGVAPRVQVWSSTAAGEGSPGTFVETWSETVCVGSGRIPEVASTEAVEPPALFRATGWRTQ